MVTSPWLPCSCASGFAQDAPKKVTKAEGLNAVTTKVPPEYPPIARQLKIEGAVELEALVSESGTVEKVNIVSGNPGADAAGRRRGQEVEICAVHQRRQDSKGAGSGELELSHVSGESRLGEMRDESE